MAHKQYYYHIYQLRETKAHFDCKPIRIVTNWPDETVVVWKQVIVETLGVWIAENLRDTTKQQPCEPEHLLHFTYLQQKDQTNQSQSESAI